MHAYIHLGLLEDMHRLDDGVPPRSVTPGLRSSDSEQPYIKLCVAPSRDTHMQMSSSSQALNIISTPDSLKYDASDDDNDNNDDNGNLNMTALLVPDLAPSGLTMSKVIPPSTNDDYNDHDDDHNSDEDEDEDAMTKHINVNAEVDVIDVDAAIEEERRSRENREKVLYDNMKTTLNEVDLASKEAGRKLKSIDDDDDDDDDNNHIKSEDDVISIVAGKNTNGFPYIT